jgi:DNA-binding CsgD family transcriptional regulator
MREVEFRFTRARQITAENVKEAARFLPNRLIGPDSVQFDAVEACRRLLASGSMMGTLVEALDTHERAAVARVIGVGAGVFVSSAFVCAEHQHPEPGLSERVLWSALASPSVALNEREIASENMNEGLNLVIALHHGAEQESDAVKIEFRRHLVMGFLQDVQGYRLSEILAEGVVDVEKAWCLAGGYRIRSEFTAWYESHSEPLPRRFLCGITRAEALADESTLLSLLFQYEPPRFGFTQSQRKLLIHALSHKTDAEIAVALGISLSAVKKTWAAIFEKTNTQFSEVEVWDAAEDSRQQNRTRGAQKRHRLLTYLLDYPEELRP